MLQPRKEKYRKQFRGKMRGVAQRGVDIAFGEFGLKALTTGWVSGREIEAARKVRRCRTYDSEASRKLKIVPDVESEVHRTS